jgi:hypothetical protein
MMDDTVRQKLLDVVKEYGWHALGDSGHFESLLLEKCDPGPEAEVLVSAVREGIAFSIMGAEGGKASDELIQELVKHLESTGMKTEDAKWAVESLRMALGRTGQTGVSNPPEGEKDKNKRNPLKRPVIALIIVTVLCLITAAICVYMLAAGRGAQDSSNNGQDDITPAISPEVSPILTVTPGTGTTAAPVPTPTTGPTPPQDTTPAPPSPSGTVRPPIDPIKPPPADLLALGNTLPNLVNTGYAAVNGGYIYFASPYDGNKLYKKPLGGGQSSKLCDDNAMWINIIGGWVYYVNFSNYCLYRVKVDGSGRQKVFDEYMYQPVIINDWVYFTRFNDEALCKRKIGSAASTLLDGDKVSSINPCNGWIYYVKGPDGDRKIWKVRYDGTEKQNISGTSHIDKLYVQSGKLFTTDYQSGILFCLSLDASVIRTVPLSGHGAGIVNFDSQWIYYSNKDDNNTLYRIGIEGTGGLRLSGDSPVILIYTGGGWIFYRCENRFYMIRPDGTGLSELR